MTDTTKGDLERFYGSEGAVPDRYDRHEECSVFPDGWAWAICTNWARYARRIEGADCLLHGFLHEENPRSEIARVAGGHDFAVLRGRYLIDGWAKHVEGLSDRAVFDLADPADAADAARLYGYPANWKRLDEIESAADRETVRERRKAMRGVRLDLRRGVRKAGEDPGAQAHASNPC